MDKTEGRTRELILRAALKLFADRGYAATSVQDIVAAVKVTKPALYYYFGSKAGLYQALVDFAHDERFRLMQKAAEWSDTLEDKLVEISHALFEFLRNNRELMRIAFATAFAAPGELPSEIRYLDKCSRNFEFIHTLIKRGQAARELDRRFDSKELAFGIYGQLNIYVMAHLLMPDCKLNRQTAERIVELFLAGAAGKRLRNEKSSDRLMARAEF
jgi:AcrR family transcriptional regulator